MKLIAPPTPASFTFEHHQPTTVPLIGARRSSAGGASGQGTAIHREIAQERPGENESEDENPWTTVHVREVGLWIMGSRGKDGGYVSVGGVHFGPGQSD